MSGKAKITHGGLRSLAPGSVNVLAVAITLFAIALTVVLGSWALQAAASMTVVPSIEAAP
jgi:hypothetical protein